MEDEITAQAGSNWCWSHLPANLLVSVFSALDVLDLFSAGGVCQSWRASHLEARRLGPSSRRSQSPCLLYSSDDHEPITATLRRLSTNKLYHVPLPGPPFRSRYVFGSSHGWVVAADEKSDPHLFNPITGAQIDLPPVQTLAPVKFCLTHERVFYGHAIFDITPSSPEIHMRKLPPTFRVEETRHALYLKAVLSSDPAGGNCTVMLLHKPHNQLSFARIGDSRWTWITALERGKHYDDCFYDEKDGLFYAINCSAEVHAIDLNGPAPVVNVITVSVEYCDECNKHIMRAPWGDLLQVWRYHRIEDGKRRTHKMAVYRIDFNKRARSPDPDLENDLVEMNDLQGNALFVGFGASFFVNVKDFPMLSPDCIYLAHDKAKLELLDQISLDELLVSTYEMELSEISYPIRTDAWTSHLQYGLRRPVPLTNEGNSISSEGVPSRQALVGLHNTASRQEI